jgi:hypothetical protein
MEAAPNVFWVPFILYPARKSGGKSAAGGGEQAGIEVYRQTDRMLQAGRNHGNHFAMKDGAPGLDILSNPAIIGGNRRAF